jgi:uncharacterized C2H2 Zn-finger protein
VSPHFRISETGLYIPVVDSSKGEPRFKCTVIVKHRDGENTYCQKPFWTEREYVNHVTRCSAEHVDEIRKAAPSTRQPDWMTGQNVTDWEDWLDKQDAGGESNRAKVIQGRKKF